MAVRLIDLLPTDQSVDVMPYLQQADLLARDQADKTVILPENRRMIVELKSTNITMMQPRYAKHWIGDPLTTEFFLKAGAYVPADASVKPIFWNHSQKPGAKLSFKFNGNAANQASRFRISGIRIDTCDDGEIDVASWNTATIDTSGPNSTFAVQNLRSFRIHFRVDIRTTDSSRGAESFVSQGLSGRTGWDTPGNEWVVDYAYVRNMFRAVGCFSGGNGIVNGLDAKNLSMPGSAKARALNIEAGTYGTGTITVNNPVSDTNEAFLQINGNDGKKVHKVVVNNVSSTNDGSAIWLVGAAPDVVQFNGGLFSGTDLVIDVGTYGGLTANQRAAGLTFNNTHYTGVTKLKTDALTLSFPGLTPGTTAANTAPVVTLTAPADGATVAAGTTIPVTVTASDDGGFGNLDCAGQVYYAPVDISSITVSGTTATVTTADTSAATVGAQVRQTGNTPAVHNGTKTITGVSGNTYTYTVASGTPNATIKGKAEVLGTSITMTANATNTGFSGTYAVPNIDGAKRRIEVGVSDDGSPILTTTVGANITASSSDLTPPTVTDISLSDGSTLSSVTNVTCTVEDPSGISSVKYRLTTEDGSYIDLTATASTDPDLAPVITTTSVPAAQVGVAYTDVEFACTNATGSETWTLDSGTLPTGATFSSAGVLHLGTPATGTNGTYSPVFKVTNANGSDTQAITLTVNASGGSMTFTPPTSLPGFKVGEYYEYDFSQHISAAAGTVTYSASGLASWATLNTSTGKLTVNPGQAPAGTETFDITANDGTTSVTKTNRTVVVDATGAFDIATLSGVTFDLSWSDTSAANRAKAVANTALIRAMAATMTADNARLWCSKPMNTKLVLTKTLTGPSGSSSNGNGDYLKSALGQWLFGNLEVHVMADEPLGTLAEAAAGTTSSGPNQRHVFDLTPGTRPVRIEAIMVNTHSVWQKQLDTTRTSGTKFGLEIGAVKVSGAKSRVIFGRLTGITRSGGVAVPQGQPLRCIGGRAVTGGPRDIPGTGSAAKDIFGCETVFCSGGGFGWVTNETDLTELKNSQPAAESTWTNGFTIQRALPAADGTWKWNQFVGQAADVHHGMGGGNSGCLQWLPGSGGNTNQHCLKTEAPAPPATGSGADARAVAWVAGYSSICPPLPWGPQLTPATGDIVTHDNGAAGILIDGKTEGLGHVEINGWKSTNDGGSGVSPWQVQGAATWTGSGATAVADGKIVITKARVHSPTSGVGPSNINTANGPKVYMTDCKYPSGTTAPRGSTAFASGSWAATAEPFS